MRDVFAIANLLLDSAVQIFTGFCSNKFENFYVTLRWWCGLFGPHWSWRHASVPQKYLGKYHPKKYFVAFRKISESIFKILIFNKKVSYRKQTARQHSGSTV